MPTVPTSIYSPFFFLPTCLRETIKTLEYCFGVRVFWPLPDGLPHIVLRRRRPRPVRCSPPPYGWSTGFIAEPRTVGRIPSQRERPALPIVIRRFSSFETVPIEAQAVSIIFLTSVEGILIWV